MTDPASSGDSSRNADHAELVAAARQQHHGEQPPDCGADDALTLALPGAGPARPPPDSFAGYEILREIHRGGQGIVYQALQKSTNRKVAIKVLLQGAYATKPAQLRFEREIELVASLRRPNIIVVFHSDQTADGQRFCVMDYVRGMPLTHYARQNNLTLEEALRLFATICEAVNHAHQKGVIHRDLKPSNILVDVEGAPKVLDFGLAKMLGGPEETLLSVTGQVVGTLPYMSPEQTRGNPDEIDTRTDVYALGVILYELLTGQYPYPVVGQMADVLKHIAETEPTPPSRAWTPESGIRGRRPGSRSRLFAARAGSRVGRLHLRRSTASPIDDDVQTIVLKALAKERERRYQSAGELGRDVAHYLAGKPIEAKRDSAWYVMHKLLLRNSQTAMVTAAVMVILLSCAIIVGYYAGRQREAESDRQATQAEFADQSGQLSALARERNVRARRMALGWFLAEWYAGRVERAEAIREEFRDNSPEYAVGGFLLDESYTFERLVSETAGAESLALFALGERHLKAGRVEEALKTFESIPPAKTDEWLRAAVEARLAPLRPRSDGTAGPIRKDKSES